MKVDQIYTLLLDQKGKILWRTSGPVTPLTQEDLRKFLDAYKYNKAMT